MRFSFKDEEEEFDVADRKRSANASVLGGAMIINRNTLYTRFSATSIVFVVESPIPALHRASGFLYITWPFAHDSLRFTTFFTSSPLPSHAFDVHFGP